MHQFRNNVLVLQFADFHVSSTNTASIHTCTDTHTHSACLSSVGCVKNSPSTECSSPPEAPERTEPTKLGFRYQKCSTPTWPRQRCIPRELIVKSQTLPLVYRPTRPQRRFIHACRSDRRQLQPA